MADPPGAPGAARAAMWSGAALFAASIAYFLFTYLVTFREIHVGPLRPADAGVNVALFGAFALHHSVFARPAARAWIARRVPPTLERSVYVWTASLMLILVCALWRPIPGVAWRATGPAVWLLHGALAGGVWLTLRSAAIIDIRVLAGLRTGQDGWQFRAAGPYGWVRHPIYSGWFLIVFGVSPMTTTRLLFALVSCAYVLTAIPLEERTLRRSSDGAYDRYARSVKWKLVPWLY